jgi:hypothetical protein
MNKVAILEGNLMVANLCKSFTIFLVSVTVTSLTLILLVTFALDMTFISPSLSLPDVGFQQ